MRNQDGEPFSLDEFEAAECLFDLTGIGGGDDPVGFLNASHRELVRQRTDLEAQYPAIFKEIEREPEGACAQPIAGMKTEAPEGSS
jgi:hypothetical protein